MRAAQFESCGGEIVVREVSYPSIPEDGVIVRVAATGVCRSDWHAWMGHDIDVKDWLDANKGSWFTPGHEVAGVVVESGSICNFVAGDRVAIPFILSCGKCIQCSRGRATVCLDQSQPGFTIPGSYAEYVAIPRADRNLTRLPEQVSFIEAASLGCRFTTAFRAVIQQGKLQAGQRVAVVGCGGLGLAAVMIACSCGAGTVSAFDVSQEAFERAKAIEPSITTGTILPDGNFVFSHVGTGTSAVVSDHDGFDLTIECSGFAPACVASVKMLKPGGRMVQAGLCLGFEKPLVPMALVAAKEIEIVGSHGFDGANDMSTILNLVERKVLCPAKLVDRQVSLEEGVKILTEMSTKSPLGVVMITSFR